MPVRIFVKFRTRQISGDPGRRLMYVANTACYTILGRNFDYQKDFLHSQGEIYKDNAPCHLLIDCECFNSSRTLPGITLHCYAVEDGNLEDGNLLVLNPYTDMPSLLICKVEVFERPKYIEAKLMPSRGGDIHSNKPTFCYLGGGANGLVDLHSSFIS
jgi:hypothetical protein